MKTAHSKYCTALILLLGTAALSSAADLTIHLDGNATFTHKKVQYKCDATGTTIGVPSGPFTVEYINGGGNSLVVVPVGGKPLIFSGVMSGSGSRYTAQQFQWWDAAGQVTLSQNPDATSPVTSTCKVVGP